MSDQHKWDMGATPIGGQWSVGWWDGKRWRTDPMPERSPWTGYWLGIMFTPTVEEAPNWFRRKLTAWAFGVRWTREPKP